MTPEATNELKRTIDTLGVGEIETQNPDGTVGIGRRTRVPIIHTDVRTTVAEEPEVDGTASGAERPKSVFQPLAKERVLGQASIRRLLEVFGHRYQVRPPTDEELEYLTEFLKRQPPVDDDHTPPTAVTTDGISRYDSSFTR